MQNPKMKFTYDREPSMIPHGKTKFLELEHDWYFWYNGKQYWIPAGYWIDGASIPWIFWALIGTPTEPDFWAFALMHDWVYLTHILTRSQADEGAYQFLQYKGIPEWKCKAIWAAVRTGGAFVWGNSPADIEELTQIKIQCNNREDGQKFQLQAA
jgi:hypothetical protein